MRRSSLPIHPLRSGHSWSLPQQYITQKPVYIAPPSLQPSNTRLPGTVQRSAQQYHIPAPISSPPTPCDDAHCIPIPHRNPNPPPRPAITTTDALKGPLSLPIHRPSPTSHSARAKTRTPTRIPHPQHGTHEREAETEAHPTSRVEYHHRNHPRNSGSRVPQRVSPRRLAPPPGPLPYHHAPTAPFFANVRPAGAHTTGRVPAGRPVQSRADRRT